MKNLKPQPFTFEAGPRAVLLLHGFTGNSADVRMLGRYLEKHGYTSHAPILSGHGLTPEALAESTPEQWWRDVQAGLDYLESLGYEEIAVAGLSLGGVLGLKLAYCRNIKALITMSAPMAFNNEEQLKAGFTMFARKFKRAEGKDQAAIDEEVNRLLENSETLFTEFERLLKEVKADVDMIYTPTYVIQARHDRMIDVSSASYIYENVESEMKDLKLYESSGHAITLGVERDDVHVDVLAFLERLDWGIE